MSGKKKIITILSCSIAVCTLIMALTIMFDYRHKKQEQEQRHEQYISDVLLGIDAISERFNDAGSNRSYRVALYNDLKAFEKEVFSGGFEDEQIRQKITELYTSMYNAFTGVYNDMVDSTLQVITDNLDDRQRYVEEKRDFIDDIYRQFNDVEIISIANDSGDGGIISDRYYGINEKTELYFELVDMRDEFVKDTFIDRNFRTISSYVDELSSIKVIVEKEGVLTGLPQAKSIAERIDECVGLYSKNLTSEEYEEILWKFDSTLEREKTWFTNFYITLINDIAGGQRSDQNDVRTINRQINDLVELKEAIIDNGVFYTSSNAPDEIGVELLDNRIDNLITSYKQEIAEINARLERERIANPGGGGSDGSAGSAVAGLSIANITEYANEVIRLTNIERVNNGLEPLRTDNSLLSYAAHVRAIEIISYWSHDRPDGRSCFTAYTDVGGMYNRVGENLAYGQRTPDEAVQGWMNSEGHRANILDSRFTQIGVGVVKDEFGKYYWTQMFCG